MVGVNVWMHRWVNRSWGFGVNYLFWSTVKGWVKRVHWLVRGCSTVARLVGGGCGLVRLGLVFYWYCLY